jgi:hypothetical protein
METNPSSSFQTDLPGEEFICSALLPASFAQAPAQTASAIAVNVLGFISKAASQSICPQ